MNKNKISDILNFFEIISFLHDIGKISSHFIISKDPELNIKDRHAMLIYEEFIPENFKNFLYTPINRIFKNINNLDNDLSPIHFICSHHGCNRCNKRGNCIGYENNFYIKLLQICDRIESSNPPNSGKQPFYETYISNFFLNENKLNYIQLDILRKKFFNFLNDIFINFDREKFFSISKFFMEKALSETRRGANDINLYTHSKAVSTIFKVLLFDYFFFNIEPPKTIFDVELRFLRVNKGYKKIIEEKIGFSSKLFSIENYEFYLISENIDNSFLKKFGIKGDIVKEIDIEKTKKNYFYPLNPNSVLFSFLVKSPEDINYNFKDLVEQTKSLLNYNKFNEIKKLEIKIKGIRKHIENLKRGNKTKEIAIKRKILKKYIQRLYYLKKNFIADFDISKLEGFLMKTLAPIRPPSITKFSNYLSRLMKEKKYNVNQLAYEIFLKKPLTISRIIQYDLDIKKIKNIKKIPLFIGKVKLTNKKVTLKYRLVKKIEYKKGNFYLNIDNKNFVIPYKKEKFKNLNYFFIGKINRKDEKVIPLKKDLCLIHIKNIKRGDKIKFIY